MQIPASYLFKDVYRQNWERPEPACEKPADHAAPPRDGHLGPYALAIAALASLWARPAPPPAADCARS